MQRIKVTAGVLHVSAGARVALSPEQAKVRAHNLKPVDGTDGLFEARVPLQFKKGEELRVAEVAKGQLAQVEFLDAAEPAEPARRPAKRSFAG